jgi:ABC-type branched-subunit amino acid transport system ATPase component
MTAATKEGSAISVAGLHAGYGPIAVLRGVSLTVGSGETVAVLGRNGVGKSTLLRAIVGVTATVSAGEVTIGPDRLTNAPAYLRASRGLGYVPEGGGVFRELTVNENLVVAGTLLRRADAAGAIEQAYSYFPKLQERCKQLAGTLSGGEQRMLALARAAVGRPRYLLLDEPTEGVHVSMYGPVMECVSDLRERYGTAVVWVDRGIDFSLRLSDRYLVLERGTVVAEGRSEQADRALLATYLTI